MLTNYKEAYEEEHKSNQVKDDTIHNQARTHSNLSDIMQKDRDDRDKVVGKLTAHIEELKQEKMKLQSSITRKHRVIRMVAPWKAMKLKAFVEKYRHKLEQLGFKKTQAIQNKKTDLFIMSDDIFDDVNAFHPAHDESGNPYAMHRSAANVDELE